MIHVENVSKTYGKQTALASTTLVFQPGATTVLIGPSGCGKSTLLRIIVGLVRPDGGRIVLGTQELTAENAQTVRHGIGYVIQDGGLFPHLTAEENVTLLARFLKRSSDEINQRIAALSDLVQLSRASLSRYPKDLSGGQRQRVGLMRALMLDPAILLFDEPLGQASVLASGLPAVAVRRRGLSDSGIETPEKVGLSQIRPISAD